MDFIKKCFEEHGGIFSEQLKEVGFSENQASLFFPETSLGIMASFQNTGVEK